MSYLTKQEWKDLFWSKVTEKGKEYALKQSGKLPAKEWAYKNGKLMVSLGYVKTF